MAAILKVKFCRINAKLNGEYYATAHLKSKDITHAQKTTSIIGIDLIDFDQEFSFDCENLQTDTIVVQTYNKDILGDIQLSNNEISTYYFLTEDKKSFSFDLFRRKKRSGAIEIEVTSEKKEIQTSSQDNEVKSIGKDETQEATKEKVCYLAVKICEAQKLRKMNKNARCDPACSLRLKSQDVEETVETETLDCTRDPRWNETFDIKCPFPDDDILLINLHDNSETGGQLCDEIQLHIDRFPIGGKFEKIAERLLYRGKPAGMLQIEVQKMMVEV